MGKNILRPFSKRFFSIFKHTKMSGDAGGAPVSECWPEPSVRKVHNAIHRKNFYPVDNASDFPDT